MNALTRSAGLLLALAVAGCTAIGEKRVQGWPALKVIEHHVSHKEMRNRCAQYVDALSSPEACAEFFFAEGECHIWFSADFPPPEFVKHHERQHCLGYEHAGEDEMTEMLRSWRRTKR